MRALHIRLCLSTPKCDAVSCDQHDFEILCCEGIAKRVAQRCKCAHNSPVLLVLDDLRKDMWSGSAWAVHTAHTASLWQPYLPLASLLAINFPMNGLNAVQLQTYIGAF
jgi:hypothetical protein